MNFLKSEWRHCNPFRNARATNKGEYRSQILPILPENWLQWQRPHGNSLEPSENESQIGNLQSK